jgi:hypothetical protein
VFGAPPPAQYVPVAHTIMELGSVEPGGQKVPGVAVQGAEHAGLVSPACAPYTPAGQIEQDVAPSEEKVPAGQMEVLKALKAGQM